MSYASRQQGNALGLSDDETKSLEQTRRALYQLSNSIQSFRVDISKSNPLPSQSSIEAQYKILLKNLQSLLDVLTENAVPFAHTSVHPAINFPGRTQENILLTLLRKKREPEVEEHVERGLETTREVRASAGPGVDGIDRLEAIWNEIRAWTDPRMQQYIMHEMAEIYTKKEQEQEGGTAAVRTGLKRRLEDLAKTDADEDEDEDEEEDEEEGRKGLGDGDVVMGDGQQVKQESQTSEQQQQNLPEPEVFFWFAARGDFNMPANVELAKDAAKRARLAVSGGMPRM